MDSSEINPQSFDKLKDIQIPNLEKNILQENSEIIRKQEARRIEEQVT